MDILVDSEAVWEPLQKALGREACREFRYMGKTALGEIWIFLYKHTVTRKYLNLDGLGNAYRFATDKGACYYPISLWEAVKDVLT